MSPTGARLVDIYAAHLQIREDGTLVPVVASDWPKRVAGLQRQERLLGAFHADGDDLHPGEWEMHPCGDELVHVLSGRCTLILDEQHSEHLVELDTGAGYLIPKGTWHRFLPLQVPTDFLAVTPSLGTQMRPVSRGRSDPTRG